MTSFSNLLWLPEEPTYGKDCGGANLQPEAALPNHPEHLLTNCPLAWDYRLGLRGAGLIVYGALPASLGALGAFKAPDQATLSPMGPAGLTLVLWVAAIPVVLTFVLVRQRLANWYVLSDFLWQRATAITIAIILISSAICLATGVLNGQYRLISPKEWLALSFEQKLNPIAHSALLSIAYLVGSSTLFLTVVKEDGNLPLLPNKAEVENISSLRKQLKEIKANELPSKKPTQNDEALIAAVRALQHDISEAQNTIKVLSNASGFLGRKKFYTEISEELNALSAAASDVLGSYITWSNYWGTVDETILNNDQKTRRSKIQRFQGLAIYG